MNQALSYIMLVVVGVMVVGPLMMYATSNVTSNAMSFKDFNDIMIKQVQQSITVYHIQHNDDRTKLTAPQIGEIYMAISNTGIAEMNFQHVLIDGIPMNFFRDDTIQCFPVDRSDPTFVRNEISTQIPVKDKLEVCLTNKAVSEPTTQPPCDDKPLARDMTIKQQSYSNGDPCPDVRSKDRIGISIIYNLDDLKFSKLDSVGALVGHIFTNINNGH